MKDEQEVFSIEEKPTNPCPKCGKQLTKIVFKDHFNGEVDHTTEYCKKECGFVRYT